MPRARCGSPSGSCSGSIADGSTSDAACTPTTGMLPRAHMTDRSALNRRQAAPREATAWDRLKVNRNWLALVVHAAGGGVPDPVPRLSARPRRLDFVHRRAHRPRRRVHRPRELRMAVGRHACSGSRCSTRCSTPIVASVVQIRDRALSRAAAQRESAVQGDAARHRADPVHRADGAVGHRVLVAVRQPVLDHLVVAAASSA